jgi:hypothetical protein
MMDAVMVGLLRNDAEGLRRQAASIGEIAIADIQQQNFQQAASHIAECQGYLAASQRMDAMADCVLQLQRAFEIIKGE